MWVSPHLHIDLEVKTDRTQLATELSLIPAGGLLSFFLLGWLSRRDEHGVLFFSFTRNRYVLSVAFVLAVSLYDFLLGPQLLTVCYIFAPIVLGALVSFCWFGRPLAAKAGILVCIIVLVQVIWIVYTSFSGFAIQLHDTVRLAAIAGLAGCQLLIALPVLVVLHFHSRKGVPQHAEA
jgi:hypothetical protein